MKFRWAAIFLAVSAISSFSQAQTKPPTAESIAPAADSATNPMTPQLDKLQNFATQTADEIGKLQIEKWKANPAAKSAAQADAESVQRNLTSALPGMIAAVRTKPDDVNAAFKLYRNLNALYDVLGTVTDATRIFGQKGQYEALSQQLQVLGSERRKLGESLEQLTASAQRELNQMRLQIKDQQEQLAAAKAAEQARKEVVVAQADTPKKPAPKKKAVTKKAVASTTSSSSNSSSSNSAAPTTTGAATPK